MPQQLTSDGTVLQGLRLKGPTGVPTLARLVGLPEPAVQATLDQLEATGLVVQRHGALPGWALTPAGRSEGQRRLSEELDDLGVRDAMRRTYEDFLTLNQPLLEVCTRWQVRQTPTGQALNDHSDADYDGAVLASLRSIDLAVQPVCAQLAALLGRFESYGPRLAAARARVETGDLEWFTRPVIDSYHTVWFELHEDLLSTLGLERAGEAARR